jgi:hypothetical protein
LYTTQKVCTEMYADNVLDRYIKCFTKSPSRDQGRGALP